MHQFAGGAAVRILKNCSARNSPTHETGQRASVRRSKNKPEKAPRIKRPQRAGRMLTVKQMAEALTLSSDVVYDV
jgi:hypothetical protein